MIELTIEDLRTGLTDDQRDWLKANLNLSMTNQLIDLMAQPHTEEIHGCGINTNQDLPNLQEGEIDGGVRRKAARMP